MLTNTQLLAIAKKQIGNGGTKYRKYVGAGGNYCNMYVYWLFNANGCGSLFPLPATKYYRTYCPDSIKWCRKNLAEIPPYIAMACDIIYFDWEPNGRPNHIGIVDHKISTSQIATIEGNTSGGIVAAKKRNTKYTNIFRPHFKGTYKKVPLVVDGDMGYQTIGGLQAVVGTGVDTVLGIITVKKTQTWAGTKADGAWGRATSRGIQKKIGLTGKDVDGDFGEKSVRKLQTYINGKLFTVKTTTTAKKPTTTTTKPKATLLAASKDTRKIEVDLTNQICTVYGKYSDGTWKPLMSEFVSTARKGCTTPVGNWKIQGASGGRKAKLRTAKMSSGKSYAEFLVRFKGGKCMHTVPYKERQTTGHVTKSEFNKLGTPRSSGCVRMPWKLAKYIYETCPVGTPVKVFKGKKGVYPMGKPKKYTATSNVDPTYK